MSEIPIRSAAIRRPTVPPKPGSQKPGSRCFRNSFAQQLETLAPNLGSGVGANARDIAPGVCQAVDNPKDDWVGHQSNDGDGSRSGLEVQRHARRSREDQVRLVANDFVGQPGRILSRPRVSLEHDILSFDVTKPA